jgi:hypothetical protein
MATHFHAPKPKAGRFTIDYVQGRGWVVVSPEGNIVSGPNARETALRSLASHQRQADQKAKRGPRACMCCSATFDSQGPHNRLCDTCRRRPDDAVPCSYHRPKRGAA